MDQTINRRELLKGLACASAVAFAGFPLAAAEAGERKSERPTLPPIDHYALDELPIHGHAGVCSSSKRAHRFP